MKPETLPSRAFWVAGPGRGELRQEEVPLYAPRGVRIRTLYTGVSRGTEALVFRGEVPAGQYNLMRAPFQEGDFPGPVKYGYSNVGVVEAVGGEEARERAEGLLDRAVFSLHPHQERFWCPVEAVTPLPPGLPPERAVLAANMETALNGVWDGLPGPGDRVVVVGGGTVGLLTAWLCARLPAAEVFLVDPNRDREATARALGVGFGDGGGDADLVFHASGTPEGLAHALSLAGTEATVVELSWFGSRAVPLPLGEAFHSRRLTLRSSQVGTLPPHRQPRWSHRRRMEVALELLLAPELDVLLTGESPLSELPSLMARLSAGPDSQGRGTLCHRIRYP